MHFLNSWFKTYKVAKNASLSKLSLTADDKQPEGQTVFIAPLELQLALRVKTVSLSNIFSNKYLTTSNSCNQQENISRQIINPNQVVFASQQYLLLLKKPIISWLIAFN